MWSQVPLIFAWNITYDLHMLANYGAPYPYANVADGMFVARLTIPSDNPDAQNLGLKKIARTYVDPDAGEDECEVRKNLNHLQRVHHKILQTALKPYG